MGAFVGLAAGGSRIRTAGPSCEAGGGRGRMRAAEAAPSKAPEEGIPSKPNARETFITLRQRKAARVLFRIRPDLECRLVTSAIGQGIDISHKLGDQAPSGSKKSHRWPTAPDLLRWRASTPLGEDSTTGSPVWRQHEQDIVDPSSIIEFFQQHPADITPVDTIELIRIYEAVTLLVWPGVHAVAVT
jgi:hypothetical protein